MKKSGILLFYLASLTGFQTTAQYTISGTVKDLNNGELLPAAAVYIDNSQFSALTDNEGSFILKNVPDGEYNIQASYVGYTAYQAKIKVSSDITLVILLKPGILLKETAIIQATRVPVNAPATITYLNKKDIESKNTGLDLPFLLSSIPSAVITSDAGTGIGYTGIRIRGTDMTRINVTVNGIPFNDAESHEVYWVDMPDIASSIDNIEIQRGVGTSSNGAASFGGSINIVTNKTQAVPNIDFNASYGSFNSFRTTLNAGTGLIKGKYSFDARLSKIGSDGYIDRAKADLKSFFTSATYLGSKTMLKINVFSGKERTYQAWDGIPGEILDTNRTFNVNGMYYDSSGNMRFYNNEIDDYSQDNYQLFFNQDLPGNISLTTALHYTRGKGYYEQYKQDADPLSYGIITTPDTIAYTDLITRKWLKNDFYGITWSLIKSNADYSFTLGGACNQYLGDHFGNIIWSSKSFVQLTPDFQWYFNQGDKQDANVYSKFLWSVSKKTGILADIQYRYIHYSITGKDDDFRDLTQQHFYSFFNPKAGLILSPSTNSKVHLYLGIANREPNRTNFKDADTGSLPGPEKLYNFELGYEVQDKKFRAGVNVYYMYYNDQLVLTGKINNVGAPVMVNVPKSYRTGIELTGEANIHTIMKWAGNLTVSQNKIQKFTEYIDDWSSGGQIANEHKNTDLSFSPGITANSNISLTPIKNLDISIITKYTGKQYIDNTSDQSRKLDPYFINDLRITYSVKTSAVKSLEFSLLLNNLFNELYETNAWVYRYYYEGNFYKMDGYFPQATRNFMAGLKIKL
ncbi:MAG: TonB-dependent receptor [Bacteroidales bacterium]